MRIGIYSGTFDPIHEGHVLFAQVAAEQFGLDKVLLMPETKPRYKEDVTDIEHRHRMCSLAALSSHVEMIVESPENLESHTMHGVLRQVHEKYPDDEYFILMGSDVFRGVGTWGDRDDEEGRVTDVAGAVGFIVAIQSMKELDELKKLSESMSLNVRYVEPPLVTLSSRDIRKKIQMNSGDAVHGLNDDVLKYIELEQLYGSK